MTKASVTFRNGLIFDGSEIRKGCAARFVDGVLVDIGDAKLTEPGETDIDLKGDILCPGYFDLQVNGGGGIMFNDDPSVDTLRRIAGAHRGLGVQKLLPTLITDTPEVTRAAIAATVAAIKADVPGIAGLHLEGPHLSVARKGAHDAALIRRMEQDDLDVLVAAAGSLPVLKVTIAPENVTLEQVAELVDAGVVVSLGHSDADFETCLSYAKAGARCVTHLFNAMSQIGNRQPGLAGAALASGELSSGLIADAVHVHPEVMRLAFSAKRAPGQIFLVSDAMAVAGTDNHRFELNEREILRKDGQLRLADGTLAGADLDLTRAVSVLVNDVGIYLGQALAAATRIPAQLCGLTGYDLRAGESRIENLIRIRADLGAVQSAVLAEDQKAT